MQRIIQCLVTVLLILVTAAAPAWAQSGEATFSLDPKEGAVILNKEFSIDVILKSGGNTISTAKASLEFDPDMLEVTKVQYDSIDQQDGKLFCQFPQTGDQYVVDNDQGLVIVTGISSGTADCPYFQDSEGIFARVFFNPIDTGSTTVSFTTGGTTGTTIIDNKSPPQTVIAGQPEGASFTIISQKPTTPLPNTGILSNGLLVVSIILAIGGIAMAIWQTRKNQ